MNPILEVCERILPFLCSLLDIVAVSRFCKNFFRTSRKKEAGFLVLSGLSVLLIGVISNGCPVSVLIWQIIFCGLIFVFFQSIKYKKLFACAVLTAARALVWNFTSSLLSLVSLLLLKLVKQSREFVIGTAGNLFIGCASYLAGIAVVLWMSKSLSFVFEKEERSWYWALSVPLFLAVLIVDVMNFGASYGIMVRSGGNWGIYYDQIFSHAGICTVTALLAAGLGSYILGMERIHGEQEKKEQYVSQIKYYQMLEEQYGQMERLRHDLKNHIITMQGLSEEKDWEKMRAYLLRMEEAGGLTGSEDVTGNRAVDALLFQKRMLAESKKIHWNCSLQIPKDTPAGEFALCVLLGNILDNAIEACERIEGERFIEIQSGMIKKCFLLEIKNSTDLKDIQTLERSQKRGGKESGIGMANIRDTLERLDGAMDIEFGNDMLRLSVLIPLKGYVHDRNRTS